MNRRVFVALFLAIFAAVTGVGIVVPLLPVFAQELGAGGFLIGMIFGSFSISRTALLPVFGRLSDEKGRKPFIVAGLFFYTLASLAFLTWKTVNGLIVIRFFQGAASALILPVAQAYVGEITPSGREGLIMGLFNISMYASLSLGPLAGGLVHDVLGLDAAFLFMGGLCLVAFFLALFLLPKTSEEPRARRESAPQRYGALLGSRVILGLIGFRATYTLCIGIIWAFLPVFAHVNFGISSSRIGILVMLGVAVAGVLQIPMGWLADRTDRRFMVATGGILMAGAVYSYNLATGFWPLFFSNVAFGVGGGVAVPALMALSVLEGKRANAMGSVMALLTMAHSLGMLVGSLVAGVVMDLKGLGTAYVAGAFIMLLGVGAFLWLTRPESPDPA